MKTLAVRPCTLCNGERDLLRFRGMQPAYEPCPRCNGTGDEPQGLPPVQTALSPPEA